MSFHWTWPDSWDSIKEPIKASLETTFRNAMNENPSETVRGEIVIEDFHFGTDPPEMHFAGIRELSMSKTCLEIFIKYKGDAFLKMSGLEINLDSCVKDTPFFCPFGMKLCNVEIESVVKISCEKIPQPSLVDKQDMSANGAMTLTLNQSSSTKEEDMAQLTSVAAVRMAIRASSPCLQSPIFESFVQPLSNPQLNAVCTATVCPIEKAKRAHRLCLSTTRVNRMYHSPVKHVNSANCPATTMFRYALIPKERANTGKSLEIIRLFGPPTTNSVPGVKREVLKESTNHEVHKGKNIAPKSLLPMSCSVSPVENTCDVLNPHSSDIIERLTTTREISSDLLEKGTSALPNFKKSPAFLQAEIARAISLKWNARKVSNVVTNKTENLPKDILKISIQFDRNPLRNFVVQSNFSSVDGADAKVEATLRSLVDPVLEKIQKDGFTLII